MVSFKDVFIGYYNISNSSLICYSILALHDINILHNDYYILYMHASGRWIWGQRAPTILYNLHKHKDL